MAARVIGFINQKGGCGKTTTCLNVATGIRYASYRVLIVDSDKQKSAVNWKAAGEQPDNIENIYKDFLPDVVYVAEDDLVEYFNNNPDHINYDYILIDSPAGEANLSHTGNIIKLSDTVIMPLAPSYLDVWSTKDVIELVKIRQKATGKPNAGLIIARAKTRNAFAAKLESAIEQTGIQLLGRTTDLVAYVDTVGDGQTLYDSSLSNKANVHEIARLDLLCKSVLELDKNTLLEEA